MRRKTSEETKALMRELYFEGLTSAEIGRRANVSYSVAYAFTSQLDNQHAYSEYLARKKGFASLRDYQEHSANLRKERDENK